MPIDPLLTPVPVRVTVGPHSQRLVLCPWPSCATARAAGVANGTRAANAGRIWVPREASGLGICGDCGRSWRISTGAYEDA